MTITSSGSVHLARMICILLLQLVNHEFSIYSFAARIYLSPCCVRKKRALFVLIIYIYYTIVIWCYRSADNERDKLRDTRLINFRAVRKTQNADGCGDNYIYRV